jgi:hypothetical protein
MKPPKVKRVPDQPDAFVYADEAGTLVRLCRHCMTGSALPAHSTGTAFREAQMHLWSSHSKRFVWIDYSDPRQAAMVQLALPIVLAHNTTRHG